MELKEIKQEIRTLSKLKRKCRVGSIERKELNAKIKELKLKISVQLDSVDKEKEELIKQIEKLDELTVKVNQDLTKFSKDELRTHIENLKRRKK